MEEIHSGLQENVKNPPSNEQPSAEPLVSSEVEALRNDFKNEKDIEVAVELLQKQKEQLEHILKKVLKEKKLRDDFKNEKDRVTRRRDELYRELSAPIDKLNRWKEKIEELGSKQRSVVEDFECLKLNYDASEKALKKKEEEVKSTMKNFESEFWVDLFSVLKQRLENEISLLMEEMDCEEMEISRLEAENLKTESNLNNLGEEKKKLEKELDEFRGKCSKLEKSNKVEFKKSKKMASEIEDLIRESNRVWKEKRETDKEFYKEKRNAVRLDKEVSKSNLAGKQRVIDDLNAEIKSLLEEKIEMQKKYADKLVEDDTSHTKEINDDHAASTKKYDELTVAINKEKKMFMFIFEKLKEKKKQLSEGNEVKYEVMKINKEGFEKWKPVMAELEEMMMKLAKKLEKMKQEVEKLKSMKRVVWIGRK